MDPILVLIMALMYGFFIFMRYYKNITIYNFFAIAMLIAMATQYAGITVMLVAFVIMIIWHLADTFIGGLGR